MRPRSKQLEKALQLFPPFIARKAKKIGIPWRARKIAKERREARKLYGSPYKHHVLFIAGLPKSGTTWLENMLSAWPGLGPYLIPDVAHYELKNHESTLFELPNDFGNRFEDMLAVTKMHIHASDHNISILTKNRIPWIAIDRDLRDVAVSYHFYVKSTPWHPSHKYHAKKNPTEGLLRFGKEVLPNYAAWVHSWKNAAQENPDGLLISYEDLLKNTNITLKKAAVHFGLDIALIETVSNKHKMKKQPAKNSSSKLKTEFTRKGISGDWKNYFNKELEDLYNKTCGELLESKNN